MSYFAKYIVYIESQSGGMNHEKSILYLILQMLKYRVLQHDKYMESFSRLYYHAA